MKNKISKLVAVCVFMVVAFSASAGSWGSMYDDYRLTPVDKQELQAGVESAWVLSYNENGSPLTITLQQTKKCKTYIVRGSHFEVAYDCTAKGFGARNVKMSESKMPEVMTSQVINASELAKQRIISTSQLNNELALDYIAAYLPSLVNPSYQHLLN
ncbi:hypothetical protein [Gaoshiqia sp. Z1-71]|uniref:hypothetical protein n=1 Tax=Gaoshiqia hydrogeniformans TaxID=3290090 RepID=UPI003BF859F8